MLSEESGDQPNMPALLREALGCEKVYPVHRLDRTTQGLMLYAKTAEGAKRLSAAVQKNEVQKIYHAVAEGAPDPPHGEMTDLLFFDRRRGKSYVVTRERKGVKRAKLSYQTLSSAEKDGKTLSLLRITLETGRTHQIRVQLASRRHPIVGDRSYGSSVSCMNIMLCSAELHFDHPFTGERLDFYHYADNDYFWLFEN